MTKTIQIIADENISGLENFEKLGLVTKVSGRSISSETLNNADALLVRSVTKVDKNLLDQSNVKFVASATSGIDHVDVDYLQEQNIGFGHAPGSNANSVVQYVFASLAFLSNKYHFDWRQLSIGIVGAGQVGGLLADYLKSLEVPFVIYDPLLETGHRHSDRFVTFEEVLRQDAITIHTPLSKDGPYPTWHLFNEKVLGALSKNCIIINSSRGAVFDNQSLHTAYKNNSWRCVLDVWENEPDIFAPLLAQVDISTSHIAGYSYEGKEQGSVQIYQAFVEYFGIKKAEKYPINVKRELLDAPKVDAELEQINKVILEAYSIEKDHQQLQDLLRTNLAEGFDYLRKAYPLRREFQSYYVDYSSLVANVEHTLRTLGFN